MLATLDMKDLLTDKKLKAAFKEFDVDGGGSISAKEIV
jgi:Ca2+-binding EF-hand superfamily protein